jgi:hypothetical protein
MQSFYGCVLYFCGHWLLEEASFNLIKISVCYDAAPKKKLDVLCPKSLPSTPCSMVHDEISLPYTKVLALSRRESMDSYRLESPLKNNPKIYDGFI